MTAENIYLYLFLVGVFFAIGNLAISGIGHMLGGLSVHTNVGGEHAIDTDGHIELGDHGGIDNVGYGDHGVGFDGHGGVGFGDHGAGFDSHVGDGFGDHGAGFGDHGAGIGDHGAGFNHGIDTGDTVFIDHGGAFSNHGAGIGGHGGYAGDSSGGGGSEFHGDSTTAGFTAGAGAGVDTSAAVSPGVLSLLMTWLPLRPTAMICFSAVTGGLGSILLRLDWPHTPIHIISITSGYGLSMLIGVALPRKLRRAQNTSAAERYELIGLPATVTSAILDGGFGRITYTVRDNAYSAPARHIEGRRVEQGDRVVICEIKQHVFYVTELVINV